MELNQFPEVDEYSISGWIKWVSPARTEDWHIVARLALGSPPGVENIAKAGDRTLVIWKGNGFYHFATYKATGTENEINVNYWQNINYGDQLEFWTYVYFGYSR